MMRTVCTFLASLSLSAVASAAPYETLSCHKTIDQDLTVTSRDGTTTVSLHASNGSTLELLRRMLPAVPDTLLRAYGCIEFDLPFADAECAFDGTDESLATCESQTRVDVEVRGKLSCYDFDRDWDRYQVAVANRKVETRQVDRNGSKFLRADYTLSTHGQAVQWSTSSFALHRWEYDGFPQSPECSIDGAPLYRN